MRPGDSRSISGPSGSRLYRTLNKRISDSDQKPSMADLTHIPYLSLIQIAVAYILDLLLGDPQWAYHPVRLIGRSIEGMEFLLRKYPLPERMAGIFLTTGIVTGTYFITIAILSISKQWYFFSFAMAGIVIIYFTVSIKCLGNETKKVMTFLKNNDVIQARKALSQIVGRDTAHLNTEQILRACIETVAEGTVDGILSPLFYCFIGGPAAAMAYRSINTLDSMVGYTNDKYIRMGWASARLDDIANYIPARMSAVFIPMASFFCGCSFQNALRTAIRDGHKHNSLNSGFPEAAFAGALKVQLGGPSVYHGELVDKPVIGEPKTRLTLDSLAVATRIMYVTSLLFLLCGAGIFACLKYYELF
ncbi:MAG: adenosylcobinamide-phosphate synthase CbiB [Candidatus Brocadiaceae bacterium]|nr:adenosylcobinamide-phosphate synthase CbiB [Candidatus Brocadiaceae bacterium]